MNKEKYIKEKIKMSERKHIVNNDKNEFKLNSFNILIDINKFNKYH